MTQTTSSGFPKSDNKLLTYLGIVTLIVLCLALLLTYLFAHYRTQLLHQAGTDSMNLARVLDERLSLTFKRLDTELLRIARNVTPAELRLDNVPKSRERLERSLVEIKTNFPEISDLYIFDATGNLLYSSVPDLKGFNASNREHFVQLMQRPKLDLAISDVIVARTTGKSTIVIARAIRSEDGRFLGMTSALLNLDEFKRLFETLEIGRGGIIGVRTNEGARLVLRHPERPEGINKGVRSPISQRVDAGEMAGTAHFVSPVDGISRVWSFRNLGHYPFNVTVALSDDEVLSVWYERAYASAAILAALFLILVYAIYRLWLTEKGKTELMHELQINKAQLQQQYRQLEKSNQHHLAIEEAITESLWLFSSDGCVVSANQTAANRLGMRREDVIGKNIFDLFTNDVADRRLSKMLETLETGKSTMLEDQRNGRDFVSCFYPVLNHDGTCEQAVVIGTDITNRKKLESELADYRDHLEKLVQLRTEDLKVAKEAAESASRAKTAFLSIASHELRTPMSGILGTISLAIRKTSDPVVLDYLTKADRAARQLLAIINDVLDISRIESNRLSLASTFFTPDEIRTHVLDATASLAEGKHLQLAYSQPDDLANTGLIGDPTRLTQILINLVGNAIKFTAAGQVTVTLTEKHSAESGRTRLHFVVEDTGIGINRDDLIRIFEPFEQADGSISRQHGGTGLGLSLCKHLIEAMGGEMGVDSTPGQGSRFWFAIELECATQNEAADACDQAASGDELIARHRGACILVVEDEALNQEIVQTMLEAVGLNVFLAEDGIEAVDYAQSGRFDLILMDVSMPRMNGIEATYAIRRIPQHAHTPIVALTANAFTEDRDACIQSGMNDHIGKPVTPESLYAMVLRWLDREAPAATPAEQS